MPLLGFHQSFMRQCYRLRQAFLNNYFEVCGITHRKQASFLNTLKSSVVTKLYNAYDYSLKRSVALKTFWNAAKLI